MNNCFVNPQMNSARHSLGVIQAAKISLALRQLLWLFVWCKGMHHVSPKESDLEMGLLITGSMERLETHSSTALSRDDLLVWSIPINLFFTLSGNLGILLECDPVLIPAIPLRPICTGFVLLEMSAQVQNTIQHHTTGGSVGNSCQMQSLYSFFGGGNIRAVCHNKCFSGWSHWWHHSP